MSDLLISRLTLTNFRNFTTRSFDFSNQLTFLFGQNGVGKTNILEAMTLLGRGASLCNSAFEEMLLLNYESKQKEKQFVVHAKISNHDFIEQIAAAYESDSKKRNLYINGELLSTKRQGELRQHLINFIYITPQIEQLFILGKTARRDYLDRIVSDLDLEHSTRLNQYQKLLRERLVILQKYGHTPQGAHKKWLEVVEGNIVEIASAIAHARIEAINFFNKAITSFSSQFPQPQLLVFGEAEEEFSKKSAVQFEDAYRSKLEATRQEDHDNFRTEFGVHRSDFDAIFSPKNASALYSSTGEQKAIMLGITLARAKISASYRNQPTIMIFDEAMSHLDENRRFMLLEEIKQTKLQSFCSATAVDLIPTQQRADVGQLLV